MKKLLYMYALSAILLAACTEAEYPIPEDKYIEYPEFEGESIEFPKYSNENKPSTE